MLSDPQLNVSGLSCRFFKNQIMALYKYSVEIKRLQMGSSKNQMAQVINNLMWNIPPKMMLSYKLKKSEKLIKESWKRLLEEL